MKVNLHVQRYHFTSLISYDLLLFLLLLLLFAKPFEIQLLNNNNNDISFIYHNFFQVASFCRNTGIDVLLHFNTYCLQAVLKMSFIQ